MDENWADKLLIVILSLYAFTRFIGWTRWYWLRIFVYFGDIEWIQIFDITLDEATGLVSFCIRHDCMWNALFLIRTYTVLTFHTFFDHDREDYDDHWTNNHLDEILQHRTHSLVLPVLVRQRETLEQARRMPRHVRKDFVHTSVQYDYHALYDKLIRQNCNVNLWISIVHECEIEPLPRQIEWLRQQVMATFGPASLPASLDELVCDYWVDIVDLYMPWESYRDRFTNNRDAKRKWNPNSDPTPLDWPVRKTS